MNETRFTDDEVMTTLREVVAERPEYVYEPPAEAPEHAVGKMLSECYYVHNDGPGCLVGHVMHRLGMPLDELKNREFSSADVFSGNDTVSVRAAQALADAQDLQDNGDTWAEALDAAEAAYERES